MEGNVRNTGVKSISAKSNVFLLYFVFLGEIAMLQQEFVSVADHIINVFLHFIQKRL